MPCIDAAIWWIPILEFRETKETKGRSEVRNLDQQKRGADATCLAGAQYKPIYLASLNKRDLKFRIDFVGSPIFQVLKHGKPPFINLHSHNVLLVIYVCVPYLKCYVGSHILIVLCIPHFLLFVRPHILNILSVPIIWIYCVSSPLK